MKQKSSFHLKLLMNPKNNLKTFFLIIFTLSNVYYPLNMILFYVLCPKETTSLYGVINLFKYDIL